MQISVKSNIKDVLKDYRSLSKDIKSTAIVRSLNLVATKANTQVVDKLKTETGLKKSYIRRKLQKIKATRFTLTAALKPTTRRNLNIIEWVTPAHANRWLNRRRLKSGKLAKLPVGVTSKAWGKKKVYDGTFVVRGRNSGKPVVVSRRNNKRTGWSKSIWGPSVWSQFDRYAYDATNIAVNKHFSKEFERQVKLLVDKQRK